MVFFFLYIFIIAVSVLAVSLDGKDILSSATAVIAAIGNIGPGLGAVGPTGSYADFSVSSKLILSICMIVGRLEIYPILLLFSTTF
jgi:trk system potassium uptake protein TrkH